MATPDTGVVCYQTLPQLCADCRPDVTGGKIVLWLHKRAKFNKNAQHA